MESLIWIPFVSSLITRKHKVTSPRIWQLVAQVVKLLYSGRFALLW